MAIFSLSQTYFVYHTLPRTGAGVVSEVYGRSLGGSSSEIMARAQNPKFNHGTRDEREAAAHEEPPYRDRSVDIALHEANSWREVS